MIYAHIWQFARILVPKGNARRPCAHLVRFDPRAVGLDLVRFCLFLTLCADGGPDLVRLKRFWKYLLAYCF